MTQTSAFYPTSPALRGVFFLIALLGPILFGFLALALGQDANWDLRNYHWYNAYAFLNDRHATDLLPSQTPNFYNPVLDVPFYLLANSVSAKTASFVLATIQGINFSLLLLLAFRLLPFSVPSVRLCASVAVAVLGLLGGGGIAELGTTFYDNIVSLGVFGSLLLVIWLWPSLSARPLGQALALAALAGLPVGLAMGLKQPTVLFCVGLCFAFLLSPGAVRRRFFLSFGFGLGITAGLLIFSGHWMLTLWQAYGNPLFPYFNDLFKSPLAAATDARDVQFVVQGFWDSLLFPFTFALHPRRVGEIDWQDLRIPILYLLLYVMAAYHLFSRKTTSPLPPTAVYVLCASALSYLVWLKMFCIYRYLIPLEMLAPLLIVLVATQIPLKTARRSMILACAALLIIAVTVRPGNWGRVPFGDKFIETKVPLIPAPETKMLLMAGFEPMSWVLSSFPARMPVVRVQSNFSSPDQPEKGINKIISQRVSAHKGDFLLLIPAYQHPFAKEALAHYGLAADFSTCRKVENNLYSPLDLCPVLRVPPAPEEAP
jgi:hypothetical protein